MRRSKELPEPSAPDESALTALASQIQHAIQYGRTLGQIGRTHSAREAWAAIYHDLSADRQGLAGALLGRAEAQVMRLSALYAVLDRQPAIDLIHLKAALALWQYAEASTRLIFGDCLGDPDADSILRAIQVSGELSDSELSNHFGRHRSAAKLERAKAIVLETARAHCETVETGGRPRTVWRLGAKKAN